MAWGLGVIGNRGEKGPKSLGAEAPCTSDSRREPLGAKNVQRERFQLSFSSSLSEISGLSYFLTTSARYQEGPCGRHPVPAPGRRSGSSPMPRVYEQLITPPPWRGQGRLASRSERESLPFAASISFLLLEIAWTQSSACCPRSHAYTYHRWRGGV